MVTIVLLTDFGDSPYTGIMKGVIKNINPEVEIIDLNHSISPQNVIEAAFVLNGSYKYFPKESIFVCVVDPGVGTSRKILIVKTKDYTFVVPDNGIMSLIIGKDKPVKVVSVENKRYFLKKVSNTFHGRDIFAPVAAYLSQGIKPVSFGKTVKKINKFKIEKPEKKGDRILGLILYVDRFGNLISNIESDMIKDKKKDHMIMIKGEIIKGINNSYEEVLSGQPLALIGSFGYLEISLNQGSAKDYFGCGIGTVIDLFID